MRKIKITGFLFYFILNTLAGISTFANCNKNICKSAGQNGNASITGTGIITPRMRVIMDNDFGGDPDGLFALAHLLLSPSVEVRAIIGSHLNAHDGFDRSKTQADNATKKSL